MFLVNLLLNKKINIMLYVHNIVYLNIQHNDHKIVKSF